jgi:hypothetical protein
VQHTRPDVVDGIGLGSEPLEECIELRDVFFHPHCRSPRAHRRQRGERRAPRDVAWRFGVQDVAEPRALAAQSRQRERGVGVVAEGGDPVFSLEGEEALVE